MGNLEPVTIDVSKFKDYEKGVPVRLVWTGDWHVESIASDYDAIKKMLTTESKKPNTYFAHGGDFFNFVGIGHPHASTAMGGTLFEFTRPEFLTPDWGDKAFELVYDLLGDDNKWLMLHSGNHDRRFELNGSGIIKKLAGMVGAEYGGVHNFWSLRAERKTLRIASGHGYGGGYGEYLGGLQNKLSRMLGRLDVDLLLLAHYHQGVTANELRLGQRGRGLGERIQAGAITPSMVRAYKKGQMNYWSSRWGPYRGIGYVLVKWSPRDGFFKPEIITM